jgi:hypothetical protein
VRAVLRHRMMNFRLTLVIGHVSPSTCSAPSCPSTTKYDRSSEFLFLRARIFKAMFSAFLPKTGLKAPFYLLPSGNASGDHARMLSVCSALGLLARRKTSSPYLSAPDAEHKVAEHGYTRAWVRPLPFNDSSACEGMPCVPCTRRDCRLGVEPPSLHRLQRTSYEAR